MADGWTGRAGELVVDPTARTTVGNATNALDDVYRTGATDVVVVTSRWHAPRAGIVFSLLLRGTGATVVTDAPRHDGGSLWDWLRELPSWVMLPFQLARRW